MKITIDARGTFSFSSQHCLNIANVVVVAYGEMRARITMLLFQHVMYLDDDITIKLYQLCTELP